MSRKNDETYLVGWSTSNASGMMNAAVGSPFWLWATEMGEIRMTAYGAPIYADGAAERYFLYHAARRRDLEVEIHGVTV